MTSASTPLRQPLALALLLLLLAVAHQPTSASDCSATQVAAIRALDTNATAVCGASVLSPSAAAAICDKPECLAFIVSLEPQVPYCEIAGVNLRTVFAFASSYCSQQTNASDAVSYTKPPPGSGAPAMCNGPGALLATAAALLVTLALAL